MPKNRKELGTCHICGLEDLDACENSKTHRSSLEPDKLPCKLCSRNPEIKQNVSLTDFYSEQWTGMLENGRLNPTIEDPDPQVLHSFVNVQVRM